LELTDPAINAGDSVRAMAIDAVRIVEARAETSRPRAAIRGAFWCIGAAVISFAAMAGFERRASLGAIVKHRTPDPAAAVAAPPAADDRPISIAFTATRPAGPVVERPAAGQAEGEMAPSKTAATAAPVVAAAAPPTAMNATAGAPTLARREAVAKGPRYGTTNGTTTSTTTSIGTTNVNARPGSDEMAAAAALLAKAKGERSFE
jgi:hypothetical protein